MTPAGADPRLARVLERQRQLLDDFRRTQRKVLDLDVFNEYPGTEHEDIVGLIERARADVAGPMLTA